MRILLTNDDGINAPGLWRAAEALVAVGELVVCAPDREQSGTGTAVSLHAPIRTTEVRPQQPGVRTFAVEGTPADCVILALEQLLPEPVDLVVSGINHGANVGTDLLISGTVAGALQGQTRGIPSVAISIVSLRELYFEAATLLLQSLARTLPEWGLLPNSAESSGTPPHPVLLNVNLPNLPRQELTGLSLTRLARRGYRGDAVAQSNDGRRNLYWISRDRLEEAPVEEGTDLWALQQRRISITPISPDLTARSALPHLERLRQSLAESSLPLTKGG